MLPERGRLMSSMFHCGKDKDLGIDSIWIFGSFAAYLFPPPPLMGDFLFCLRQAE
jgi:hypothetical protein